MRSSPEIVFEDEFLLIIDKPSGLTVNRAETTRGQETLQEWIEQYRHSGEPEATPESPVTIKKEFEDRSGIVHRLDRDTSGLLMIAKTPQAFENLKNQFKERKVVKKYLALVHDRVRPCQGEIRAPVGRNPFNRMRFGVFPGGREAITAYKNYKNYKNYTLLELTPKTGRTHQIRVHLKYINHSIVSDPLYAGRKTLREDLKFCPRLFLHAAELSFQHPVSGESLAFSSALPADLDRVLKLLK